MRLVSSGVQWYIAQAEAAARQEDGDEMIISAGDFLIRALIPAATRLHWERVALLTFAGAALGKSVLPLVRGQNLCLSAGYLH